MSTTEKPTWVSMEGLQQAAECLKTLAHPSRLRMVEMLLVVERTVGELAASCEIPSHMASEHLRILRDRGFLIGERRGRKVFLRVAEPGLESIMNCIKARFGDAEDSTK